MRQFLVCLCLLLAVAGCQVNPVTGERHLQFYGTDWEQNIGASMYAPLRQSQGGDYRLDPELTAYVRSVGSQLAAHAKRKDELQFEFHVLNDSTPNAWALPGGKIVVNRGLLTELNSEAELAAVLGHEIVHADAAHGARAQSKGMVTQIGAIAGMVLISSKTDSSAGQQAAAIIPAIGAQLISTKYGRDAERESDYYGMQYMSAAGYDPQGAVELQETFVRLSEGRPDDWLSGLFASHPPSRERVELNRETAKALPAGGETGKDRYQQQIAFLNKVKPAYDAYDKAIAAAVKEDYPTAQSELDKALALEPREAIFHALQGDLSAESKKFPAALRSFDQAVRLDGEFFYHLLRRGQVRLELNESAGARADLEKSLSLLPTAQAHYLLGNLDRSAGKLDSARQHYEQAAQSDSPAGLKAHRELVAMEITSNPGKFVATSFAADQDGRLFCLIGNRTRVDLTGISIAATYIDERGSTYRDRKVYSGILGGGKQDKLATNWKTADTTTLDRRMKCEIEQARITEQVSD